MAKAQPVKTEPPRIKRFRRDLVQVIPRIPNNRASLLHMQQKHHPELLIDYINWRSRYVGQRPRIVTVEPAAQSDPRWTTHAAAIRDFLDKVKRGDDLRSYLSIQPHTRGYAPAARAHGATVEDKWSDKDFVLNVMGYYHFHLAPAPGRTDELIFAEVGRDTFKAIAIFGHEVFDPNSPERRRLWSAHDSIAFRGVAAGTVVASALIATSGHSLQVVSYASQCGKIVRDFEPKLDDLNFMRGLYPAGQQMPPKPKFTWGFNHLDLLIHEAVAPMNLILKKGWN